MPDSVCGVDFESMAMASTLKISTITPSAPSLAQFPAYQEQLEIIATAHNVAMGLPDDCFHPHEIAAFRGQ